MTFVSDKSLTKLKGKAACSFFLTYSPSLSLSKFHWLKSAYLLFPE